MAKTLIIYSTIGGNTGLVVEKVVELLKKADKEVESKVVDVTKPEEIFNYHLTILACPTYNQGTLEAHFQKFMDAFSKLDFSGKNFAVIGLGDNKYYPEYLTEAAGILEEAVKKAGGNLVIPALRIGTLPYKMLESLVPKWVEKIVNSEQLIMKN